MPMRRRGHAALAAWRASSQSGHIGGCSGFIKEYQTPRVPVPLISDPLATGLVYVRAQLLAGVQRFF